MIVRSTYIRTIPANSHAWMQTNFSRLIHICELVALPQKNVNSIQFEKEIVHVNHALILGSPILREKIVEDCSFSIDPKRLASWNFRTSELRPRKFTEIFDNSRFIFGNSGTQRDKNLTPLVQSKVGSYIRQQLGWLCLDETRSEIELILLCITTQLKFSPTPVNIIA